MDNRIPYHSPKEEADVLGCALINPNHIASLKLEWFYVYQHQVLAGAMIEMFSKGKVVDLLTLPAFLKESGLLEKAGDLAYIAGLPDGVPSEANFQYYVEPLEKAALRRKQAAVASEMRKGAYDELRDPYEAQAEYESALMAISRESQKGEQSNGEVLKEIIKEMEHAQQHIGEVGGLTTGIRALDYNVGGMKPGELIVTAARPGFGKSSLLANVATHLAVEKGVPIALFSLEMSRKQILERMACSLARVSSTVKSRREYKPDEEQRFLVAFDKLKRAPIHIIDEDCRTIAKIASKSRQLISQHGVRWIGIDYIGLIRGQNPKASLYERTSEVSNDSKALAVDLKVPVMAAAQLNRECVKEGRRPTPADLRDSGSVEQDADCVILIYHDAEKEVDCVVPCELLVPKSRNGPTGKADAIYDKNITTFRDVSPYDA